MPRIKRGLVALASTVALLAATGQPLRAHEPDQERLEDIQAEIEAKEEKLEAAEEQSKTIEEQLAEAERDRTALSTEIDAITGDLREEQADLSLVQASLDATRLDLRRWTERLDRAREDLRARQAILNERAATAYMLGPGAYLEVLLGADDLRSLTDRFTFVESVLTIDSEELAGVRVARTLVAERRDRVATIEGRLTEEWREVHEQTEQIAALRTEQQGLLAQVDLEIAAQSDVLDSLEEAQQRYEDAVAQLEAESAQIRGLIQGSGSVGSGAAHGQLFWPTAGPIVSGFGYRTHPVFGTTRFHSGVDIDGACGQPIWAADGGQVLSAGSNGGYGLATIIDHGDGLSTLYGHQSSIGVSSGQQVSRGQQIGKVGTTGLSTGCHLHFEVRINGEPVDPVPYLT